MAKSIYLNSLRRYTKLQSLYLSGPGSLRPVGIKQVFGIAAAAPCACHPEAVDGDRWVGLSHTDLARRLGVQGLVEPAATEVPEGRFTVDSGTILDVWRFPQTEYCVGCQVLQSWGEASGSASRPRGPDSLGTCSQGGSSGHPRRKQTLQFEFLWVCPKGHLESYAPSCPACGAHLKRAGSATDYAVPLKCTSCEFSVEITLDDTKECAGLLPHANTPAERIGPCDERMSLRRLTDASIWQGRMLTALHLPRHVLVTEEQYDRICEAVETRAFSLKENRAGQLTYVRDKLTEAGLEAGVEDADITTVIERDQQEHDVADLDDLDGDLRRAEMEEFQHLLDQDIDMPLFVGTKAGVLADGPYRAVSGLERLRATTVLTAASRLDGPESREMLWGHQSHADDFGARGHGWLPAFESFGEGLLLWIDPDWLASVTDPYEAVHTCSHVAIRALAKHAGVSQTAVRERIYMEPVPAVLLYVATGDQVGTLGGLASLSRDPSWLCAVLRDEVQAQRWCSMDPVCEAERVGACHHCLYLAETSCEGTVGVHGLTHNDNLRRHSLKAWWGR